MRNKFWTIAIAFLFIASIASVADAQRRSDGNRKAPNGHPSQPNPGNNDNGENPGNGNNGENPGNSNPGDPPGNGHGNGNGNDDGGGNTNDDPPNGTPDGSTPAEEITCDDLKHGTPGLYGLCIAFCEAQDCELDFSMEDPFANCRPANRKILDTYRKKMRPGDPDMPCIQNPCPCWSEEELDLLWPAGETSQQCFLDFPNDDPLVNSDMIQSRDSSTGSIYSLLVIENRAAQPAFNGCFFAYITGDVRITRNFFDITYDEFLVCEQQLHQKGAELGFDCFLP